MNIGLPFFCETERLGVKGIGLFPLSLGVKAPTSLLIYSTSHTYMHGNVPRTVSFVLEIDKPRLDQFGSLTNFGGDGVKVKEKTSEKERWFCQVVDTRV